MACGPGGGSASHGITIYGASAPLGMLAEAGPAVLTHHTTAEISGQAVVSTTVLRQNGGATRGQLRLLALDAMQRVLECTWMSQLSSGGQVTPVFLAIYSITTTAGQGTTFQTFRDAASAIASGLGGHPAGIGGSWNRTRRKLTRTLELPFGVKVTPSVGTTIATATKGVCGDIQSSGGFQWCTQNTAGGGTNTSIRGVIQLKGFGTDLGVPGGADSTETLGQI